MRSPRCHAFHNPLPLAQQKLWQVMDIPVRETGLHGRRRVVGAAKQVLRPLPLRLGHADGRARSPGLPVLEAEAVGRPCNLGIRARRRVHTQGRPRMRWSFHLPRCTRARGCCHLVVLCGAPLRTLLRLLLLIRCPLVLLLPLLLLNSLAALRAGCLLELVTDFSRLQFPGLAFARFLALPVLVVRLVGWRIVQRLGKLRHLCL